MTNKQCIECGKLFTCDTRDVPTCPECLNPEEKDILYVVEIWLPTIKAWGFLGKCSRSKDELEKRVKDCHYKNRIAGYKRIEEKEDGK